MTCPDLAGIQNTNHRATWSTIEAFMSILARLVGPRPDSSSTRRPFPSKAFVIRFTQCRIYMKRAFRAFGKGLFCLVRPEGPNPNLLSTADWHEPPASHPSLLCKCPDGGNGSPFGDHLENCLWLAAMCKTCEGTGWCPSCRGDGCNDHYLDGPDVTGSPEKMKQT